MVSWICVFVFDRIREINITSFGASKSFLVDNKQQSNVDGMTTMNWRMFEAEWKRLFCAHLTSDYFGRATNFLLVLFL